LLDPLLQENKFGYCDLSNEHVEASVLLL